jgi:hypothetical protein
MTPSMQKLEIVSPYAHPLCIATFRGSNLKVSYLKRLYCIDFIYLSFTSYYVVRIIKLCPFKIIIITNTCTI